MNYFENVSKLQRSTALLTFVFLLCIAGVVFLANLIFHYIFIFINMLSSSFAMDSLNIWHLHAYLTALLLMYMLAAYVIRMNYLRSGGASIAADCGGQELSDELDDYYSKRLRNVVEEVAISMGLPVPRIFVLMEDERINAFVAGYTPNDAAITVTKGALEKLNRDELQGVVAHEFSHILHYDMRINIQLIAFSSGVNAISESAWMLDPQSYSEPHMWVFLPLAPVTLLLLPLGCVGSMFTYLLKLAVNRKREYLADASAVRSMRYSTGIIGALKKIGGLSDGVSGNSLNAGMVSHMMFNDGSFSANIVATHPSIIMRIQALDPRFSEEDLKKLRAQMIANPPNGRDEDQCMGFDDGMSNSPDLTAEEAEHAGALDEHRFLRAKFTINQIPALLLNAAHHYHGVIPLLYALLFSKKEQINEKQRMVLSAHYDEVMLMTVSQFTTDVQQMDRALRLPLAALCFPALAKHPQDKLVTFLDVVDQLIHADHDMGLYKYCIGRMLGVQINDAMHPDQSGLPGTTDLHDAVDELSVLLSVMAQLGTSDVAEAERAYDAGMAQILPGLAHVYQADRIFSEALDPVWPVLDGLNPAGKQALINAMQAVMMADGRITQGESELIHAVSSILHCPLPPNVL